jgi:hypothetical protein
VDECQDLNPVFIAILKKCPLTKYLVGDVFQRIYQFMGNCNAFEHFKGATQVMLPTTYRFGNPLALVITSWLQDFSGNSSLVLVGNPEVETHIDINDQDAQLEAMHWLLPRDNKGVLALSENGPLVSYLSKWLDKPTAILCNTNCQVFTLCWSLYQILLAIQDGPHTVQYPGRIHFHYLGWARLKEQLLKDWDRYKENETKWVQDRSGRDEEEDYFYMYLILKFGERIPAMIDTLERTFVPSPGSAQVISFGTIHAVKGLQFDQVMLYSDAQFLPDQDTDWVYVKGQKWRPQDFEMFYVGATRVKYHLKLFSNMVTKPWKEEMQAYIKSNARVSIKKRES